MLRLFRAFFTDGLHIGKHEALADLAAEVQADEKQGREFGIRGVPFFILDGKYAVSGAQPVDTFVRALDTAWKAKA